jgi:hypothetical protein
MTTKASDIRELTLNELDMVSGGGDNIDIIRVSLWGYGFAVGLGGGVLCVTKITPDGQDIACVGKGEPA